MDSRRGMASARNERGGGRGGGRGGARGKKAVGGTELMVAGAVLVGLLVAVIFFYFLRHGQEQDANSAKNKLIETENKNFRLAKDWGEKAFNIGLGFVSGKEDTPDAQLLSIQGESLYNVIYERNRKDKKGKDDNKQVALNKDRLINADIPSVTRDEGGWHMVYAFGDGKSVPLVRATKTVSPDANDTVNKAGTITVMVKAEEDDHYKRARDAKAPPEPEKAPAGK